MPGSLVGSGVPLSLREALTVLAVRTEGLSKRYGRVLALDHLDLAVRPGEVFGLLGPNGAGKSTTIRLLLGLARPTAGRAWIFETGAGDVSASHLLLAYVPAEVALWPRLNGAEIPDCGDCITARCGCRSPVWHRICPASPALTGSTSSARTGCGSGCLDRRGRR